PAAMVPESSIILPQEFTMKCSRPQPRRPVGGAMKSMAKSARAVFLPLLLAAALFGLAQATRHLSARTQAASIPLGNQAALSASASIHVSSLTHPSINLADGRDLITAYSGDSECEQAIAQGKARPRAMAAADFDEDGMPDLICGYSNDGSGIIALH